MSGKSTPDTRSSSEELPELSGGPTVVDLSEAGTVELGLHEDAFADLDNVEMPDDVAWPTDES